MSISSWKAIRLVRYQRGAGDDGLVVRGSNAKRHQSALYVATLVAVEVKEAECGSFQTGAGATTPLRKARPGRAFESHE